MNSTTLRVAAVLWLISLTQCHAQRGPSANSRGYIDANDRVEVVMPSAALQLAEPNLLRLKIKDSGLTKIYIQQQIHTGDPSQERVHNGDQTLPVVYQNGDAYISLTPQRVGKVDFWLLGTFPDGGMLHKLISLYVEPSARAPIKLVVSVPGDEVLGLVPPATKPLVPIVYYDGSKEGLKIDPQFAQFKIRTEGNREVIRLVPTTGYITAVHVGHAVVETSYGGLKTVTCIRVVDGRVLSSRDDSHCSELLSSGERTEWMRQPKQ